MKYELNLSIMFLWISCCRGW